MPMMSFRCACPTSDALSQALEDLDRQANGQENKYDRGSIRNSFERTEGAFIVRQVVYDPRYKPGE